MAEQLRIILGPIFILFGGIYVAIFILVFIGGMYIGKFKKFIKTNILVFFMSVVFFYVWVVTYTFRYPPEGEYLKTMIAGYELSTPLGSMLKNSRKFENYSRERRYGEYVYSTGGDPQKVWTGISINNINISGRIIFLFSGFSFGVMITQGSSKAWRKIRGLD